MSQYRIINFDDEYSIHKVEYDEDGNLKSFEEKPVQISSSSMDTLCKILDDIEKSLAYPILTKDSFKKIAL